jgi:IS30 family transposase
MQERALIETQLTLGMSAAAISASLMRTRSTVTREMVRNGWKPASLHRGRAPSAGGYHSVAADRRARALAAKPRVLCKLAPGNPLWIIVVDHLRQGLSPAQIASTLARMPDPVRLSYETIYTALYTMPRGHLRSSLLVLMRLIPGHWEGDLIIGKGNLSQVGTLVERTTLFVALVKLPSSKADVTAQAFTEILNRFDSQLRRSMTFDQGSEMRHHKLLTKNTGVVVYFAHPHAPWERGIGENTNGLLRQYLPKGTDLSLFSQDQLDDIAWRLNTRPRKTLGWKAPAELFLPEGAFDFVQHWSAKISPVALRP